MFRRYGHQCIKDRKWRIKSISSLLPSNRITYTAYCYLKNTEYVLVGMTGVEPATSCTQNKCSTQTELHPVRMIKNITVKIHPKKYSIQIYLTFCLYYLYTIYTIPHKNTENI